VDFRQHLVPIGLILGLFLVLVIAAGQSEPANQPEVGSDLELTPNSILIPTRTPAAVDPVIAQAQDLTATITGTRPAATDSRPVAPIAISTNPSPATPTQTISELPWQARRVLGYSVQGRPIESYRLGTGANWFVVLGAIHGAHECNTYGLVNALLAELSQPTSEVGSGTQHLAPVDGHYRVPADVTLFIVPVVNPDGCALDTRLNARGIDLNRNWNTSDWISDAGGPTGVIAGSGGPYPLSEPETLALSRWLAALQADSPTGIVRLISYHSAVPPTGLVLPAYAPDGQPDPQSLAMAETYAAVTGYRLSLTWVGNYVITGQLIYWARLKGMAAIDVELPDRNGAGTIPVGWVTSHTKTNLQALLALLSEASS
jgi:hypothetical protein